MFCVKMMTIIDGGFSLTTSSLSSPLNLPKSVESTLHQAGGEGGEGEMDGGNYYSEKGENNTKVLILLLM